MNRVALAEYLVGLVGPEVIALDDVHNGWPATATVQHPDGGAEAAAMYVASVGLSQRGRDHIERRLQVKGGHAIEDDGMHTPLLLGVWHEDDLVEVERPVVVAADAGRRLGNTTQASVFVGLANLQEAARSGWSTYESSTGELIVCLAPALLPVFVAATDNDVELRDNDIQAMVGAAGLLDNLNASPEVRARVRRGAQVLVRDARFAKRVRDAYSDRCAMCGLGMGIVEAAHILPVGAAADDSPRNGLALCPNHHRLFDRHLVGVHPLSREITYHPEVLTAAGHDAEIAQLVGSTAPHLAAAELASEPRTGAFVARYAYFEGRYDWLPI